MLNGVRTARTPAPATRFLGVRLTEEEERMLEEYQRARALPNRSEAVRALVRAPAVPTPGGVELPSMLRHRLEELVEDGFARDLDGAIAIVVTLGLAELSRTHSERHEALRDTARRASERGKERRRADREGRDLLRR